MFLWLAETILNMRMHKHENPLIPSAKQVCILEHKCEEKKKVLEAILDKNILDKPS